MRTLNLLLLCLALGLGHASLIPKSWIRTDEPKKNEGDIWAVLVAGSNGFYNYRHQADICHAYHVLRDHGVAEDRIIVMMYDDIASNPSNPFPGKLFNRPGGPDVYEGVKIDYKGNSVTPDNFMAVLKGGQTEGGNGRVLQSTPKDHVFIYFSDHGGPGAVEFPSEGPLTVKELNDTLQFLAEQNRFAQLTLYIEACYSGSMFKGVLPAAENIYALTAANDRESSWAEYCGGEGKLAVCLGDTFSVAWMEDSDQEDLTQEQLSTQFQLVRTRTNRSHVLQFGDLGWQSEPVGAFQGLQKKQQKTLGLGAQPNHYEGPSPDARYETWSALEVPLKSLEWKLTRSQDPDERADLERQLREMKLKRVVLRAHVQALTKKLVPDADDRLRLQTQLGRRIRDLDCHHDVTKAFHRLCYPTTENPFMVQLMHMVVGLCEHQPAQRIIEEMRTHCAKRPVFNVL